MSAYNNKLIHPNLYERLERRYQPYSSCQKLVYLDHFVFRKMYNAVNNRNEEAESFWIPLFNILTDLRQKGKIFCPRSYLHEEETLLAIHDGYSLKKFSESVSGSMVLEYPESILLQQVILSLKRYIVGKTEEKITYSPANILIDKELETWMWLPYFDESNPNEGFVSQLQAARDCHAAFIDKVLTFGRENPQKSFGELAIIFHGMRLYNILIDFENYLSGKLQPFSLVSLEIKKFYNGDLSKKDLKESNSVLLIQVILDFLIENDKRDDISLEDKLLCFLLSNQCKDIPSFSVLSYLAAAICTRGKNGQKNSKIIKA